MGLPKEAERLRAAEEANNTHRTACLRRAMLRLWSGREDLVVQLGFVAWVTCFWIDGCFSFPGSGFWFADSRDVPGFFAKLGRSTRLCGQSGTSRIVRKLG